MTVLKNSRLLGLVTLSHSPPLLLVIALRAKHYTSN